LEFGIGGVTLAVEEVEPVVSSLYKPSHVIQTDAGCLYCVNTSQINHQSVIQVHPHIIITLETEYLTTLVGKATVNIVAIGIVVPDVAVSVNWVTSVGIVPTFAIQGEEVGIRICKQTTSS
jgi:hypothetical protein